MYIHTFIHISTYIQFYMYTHTFIHTTFIFILPVPHTVHTFMEATRARAMCAHIGVLLYTIHEFELHVHL